MKRPDLKNLDPRSKLMLMFCISTLGVIWQNPFYLALVCGVTFLILVAGRADWRQAVRSVKSLLLLIILLLIIQCIFTRQGEALLTVGRFTLVTDQGLMLGLSVGLRLLVIVFAALIMVTSESRDYLQALIQCKIPYEISFMVMVALHFLPILREEAQSIYYAVQLRGTELKNTTLRQKGNIYISMVLPILSGTIQRAKAMSTAMEARAFRLYPRRTYLRHLVLAPQDKIILVLVPGLTLSLLAVTLS